MRALTLALAGLAMLALTACGHPPQPHDHPHDHPGHAVHDANAVEHAEIRNIAEHAAAMAARNRALIEEINEKIDRMFSTLTRK